MAGELLASKTVVREESPGARQIRGVRTSILGLVGVTERGPVGVATRISSVNEYRKVFGGYHASAYVPQAVDAFFGNSAGAGELWVTRVVHYTDPTTPSSKTSAKATKMLQTAASAPTYGEVQGSVAEPFVLTHGNTIIVSVDGGGNLTATISAVAALRDSGNGTFDLANNETLTVSVNGGPVQTITFVTGNFANIDAATAAEVAAVINGQLVGASASVQGSAVRITSDRKGTGSGINVTGGTANVALGFTTGNVAGSGNVANVDAVTAAEVKTIVEAAVAGVTVTPTAGKVYIRTNTAGAGGSVLVVSTSTADDELGLDNATHTGLAGTAVNTLQLTGKDDGAFANSLTVKVLAASSGEAARFNLQVLRSGVIVETFANLSMDDTDARYVETIINHTTNGSNYIAAIDQDAAVPAPNDRPANVTTTAFSGGSDGLSGLVDADFIGAEGSGTDRTGLRCLDFVADLSLLAVPGRATAAVHVAMLTYCETTRSGTVFAVLDPPADTSAAGMVTYVESTASLINLSEYGAIYWPRLKVANPSTSIFGNGETITTPPSGMICGVYARTDASRDGGVYVPPAGTVVGRLFGVLGLETDEVLDEKKRDLIYPKRINPLVTSRNKPYFIDGVYTLRENGNFPTIAERRGVIFIEGSIKEGMEDSRHANNDEDGTLRGSLERQADAFLRTQTKNGAFRSKDPAKAFFVDYGNALNPVSEVLALKVNGRIGLATQKPAEFIVLTFGPITGAEESAS